MIHTPATTPAIIMCGGIGVDVRCESADVSLSNISQKALKMKKPSQFIICDYIAKLANYFGLSNCANDSLL